MRSSGSGGSEILSRGPMDGERTATMAAYPDAQSRSLPHSEGPHLAVFGLSHRNMVMLRGGRLKPTHSGIAAAFVLEQLNCLKRSSCGYEAVCRCGLVRTGRSGGSFPAMALATLRNDWPKHRHAPWHPWYNRRKLPGKGIRGSIEWHINITAVAAAVRSVSSFIPPEIFPTNRQGNVIAIIVPPTASRFC